MNSEHEADTTDDSPTRIRLLMSEGQNKRLLTRWLEERYTVQTSSADDPLGGAFDLAILDAQTFKRLNAETLQERKDREAPVILPYLLITYDEEIRQSPTVWQHVDDVISTPIEQDVLEGRLESLLQTRRLSVELARQNERLDRFSSVISHDLRNPLNVAMSYTEILQHQQDDTEHVDSIVDALDRMEAIIDDVLTLTRHGDDIEDPAPTDTTAVATQAWEYVDTPEATFDCDPELPVVMADERRLQQLFENLFRNALDHGSETVTVAVEPIDGGFAVTDDGPGIPEDKRDEIFESGYTTSDSGTGLGLDIVQTITQAHGWDITATTSDDGGARFEISGVESPD